MATGMLTPPPYPNNEKEFRSLLQWNSTLAGQLELYHPWLNDDPVRAYCDIVWLTTYMKQKEDIFTRIYNEIRTSIENNTKGLGWSGKLAQDKAEFDAWCRKSEEESELRRKKMKVIIAEPQYMMTAKIIRREILIVFTGMATSRGAIFQEIPGTPKG